MEERRILESWKEIATHLNRSVMTCHRWEEEFGLPIHRLDGTPKARVYAYTDELDVWLADKLHHAEIALKEVEATRRHEKAKKWWLLSTGGIAALAAAAFLIQPNIFSGMPPVPENIPTVIFFPFENPSGDEALEAWRTALPDLLLTDLRQSRYVNVMPIQGFRSTLDALKMGQAKSFSDDEMAKVADRAGADFTATGSLNRTGEDIAVNITLRNVKTKADVGSLRVSAQNEQALFDKADGLTREIKQTLSLTSRQMAHDIDEPIHRVATDSAEAFKLYSRANRPAVSNPFPEMVPALEKALALDPKFGLAYALLYSAYGNTHLEDMLAAYRKALDPSSRLSAREKLNLQVNFHHFYRIQGGYKKLAEITLPASALDGLAPKSAGEFLDVLERLASLYPDFYGDNTGFMDLVTFYLDTEEWDKAIAVIERGMITPPRKRALAQRLVNCYRGKGLWDMAEKTLEEYARQYPSDNFDFIRRDLAMDRGRYAEALDLIKKIVQLRTKGALPYSYYSQVGYILWLKDDLDGAEKAHRMVVDAANPYDERQRLVDLAAVALSRGRIEQALDFINKGFELAQGVKQPAEQERGRYFHWQLACLQRLSGKPEEALNEAEEACRDYDNPGVAGGGAVRFLHLRALLSLELGRLDAFEKQLGEIKAFVERERYPKLMRAYYHLLGLKELRQKRAQVAIQNFHKALDLFSPGRRDPLRVMCLDSLAEAYELDGSSTFAGPCYDEIAKPGAKESWTGDFYARSFYKKGKLFEERWKQFSTDSLKAQAIACYGKFLDLWGAADPVFPEVGDARARLARLEAK